VQGRRADLPEEGIQSGLPRMVVRNVREDEGRALLEMLDALRLGSMGSNAITVRILAANDHDGVCSTQILVSVLHKKGVKYTVVPVSGNTEIIEQLQQLEEETEVRSVVLLNCGASLDLQQQMEESAAPANVKCYVIDAHRPFLLANMSKRSDRVVVYDDDPRLEDPTAPGARPPADDEDEDEALSDDDGAGAEDGEAHVWEGEAGAAGAAAAVDRIARKRHRQEDRIEKQKRKRQRINDYYLSSYCAMPAAVSLFKMARQAAPASQDLLWAAAVSLVGYHELGHIGKLEYDRLAWEELKEPLDRTDDFTLSSAPPSSVPSTDPGTDPSQGMASDDESTIPTARRRLPRSSAALGKQKLKFEAEFRLMLYKHWTLEESMLHSSYFYGALELHRDKGIRSLKNFFATAGISPSAYKQLYSGMPMPIRKTIQKKFSEHGKAYGLSKEKMFLQQFVRDLGPLGDAKQALWLQEISSSDAAHILFGVLGTVPASLSGTRVDLLPQVEGGRRDTAAISEIEREAMKENFWRAFDTILCKDPAALETGIKEAVEVAKAVQSLGRFIKDTKAMNKSSRFFWCKVEQPPHMFRHHLSLRRLAVWLLHVLFIDRPKSEEKERPMMVIVRDAVRETYLCVGATPNKMSDDRDEFGHLFRSVLRADRTLKYRYDFFDKSCIEIACDDFDRFWEILTDTA